MGNDNDTMRILAVDDEPRYTWAMRAILEGAGYEVLVASNGNTALLTAALEQPDLILLDVKMPDITGIEVCRQIREFSNVPIIMLTALAEESDKVRGLDAGADDYITKPFGAAELLARVRSATRRASLSMEMPEERNLTIGHLAIDLVMKRVEVAGKEVRLTPTEYRLLTQLASQPGRVFSPDDLLSRVWGPTAAGDNHLLRQVIYRLRRKLQSDPTDPQLVVNRPGIGYVLEKPD